MLGTGCIHSTPTILQRMCSVAIPGALSSLLFFQSLPNPRHQCCRSAVEPRLKWPQCIWPGALQEKFQVG